MLGVSSATVCLPIHRFVSVYDQGDVDGDGEDETSLERQFCTPSSSRSIYLRLVSREWKSGSNSSCNCTPFLHSLLTKGKFTRGANLLSSCFFSGTMLLYPKPGPSHS